MRTQILCIGKESEMIKVPFCSGRNGILMNIPRWWFLFFLTHFNLSPGEFLLQWTSGFYCLESALFSQIFVSVYKRVKTKFVLAVWLVNQNFFRAKLFSKSNSKIFLGPRENCTKWVPHCFVKIGWRSAFVALEYKNLSYWHHVTNQLY